MTVKAESERQAGASTTPTLGSGQESNFLEVGHGEEFKLLIVESARGCGPSDRSPDRPDLTHDGSDLGGQPQSPNKAPDAMKPHSVNYEVLAEAYRRGLRVGRGRSYRAKSLDFLFGS